MRKTGILIILLFVQTVMAADIGVSPVKVFLEKKRVSSVTLHNRSNEPLTVEVSACRWSQTGGERCERTDEILFYPVILKIPPQEERTVRVGARVPPGETERTYRLYIEEISKPPQEKGVILHLPLRVGIPVFIPPQKKKPDSLVTVEKRKDGPYLTVVNTGNVHLMPVSRIGEREFTFWYVLPGNSASFKLPDVRGKIEIDLLYGYEPVLKKEFYIE
jgi:fimbrial chaperone protein